VMSGFFVNLLKQKTKFRLNYFVMERIVLEAGDETARAWRNTSAKLRAQIEKNLEMILGDSLSKVKEANFELLLREARNEAAANGLTEEILTKLLNEED